MVDPPRIHPEALRAPEKLLPLMMSIPRLMRQRNQWVGWKKLPPLPGKNRPRKVPFNPNDWGREASTTDPSTWGGAGRALEMVRDGQADGIGYVFAEDDGLVGIDLDDCIPEGGALPEAWAQEIVDRLETYAEFSPSRTGLHLIIEGKKPEGLGCRRGKVECYEQGRYFTVTCEMLPDVPPQVAANQDGLDFVLTKHLGTTKQKPAAVKQTDPSPRLTDDEVCDVMFKAKNGEKIRALWSGDIDPGKLSESDFALAAYVAFYTQDPVQIERLMRLSELERDKWDSKRGDTTWIKERIDKAIAQLSATYTGKKKCGQPKKEKEEETDDSLTPNAMGETVLQEHVILRDEHGHAFEYTGRCWDGLSGHVLESYCRKADTRWHTSRRRRDESASFVLVESQCRKIEWNRLADAEVPTWSTVVNATTGECRGFIQEDYLDRIIPHSWDPQAECPIWIRCLKDWFGVDDDYHEKVAALQEFFGYVLLPHAKYKKALLCYGDPNTGKSVVVGVMADLVGKENTCGIAVDHMDDPRKLAPIRGKALNLVSELSHKSMVADGGFKTLVSTGEPVMLDQKFQRAVLYVPTCKHVIATNTLPRISDTTWATYNRLLLIKFSNAIPKDEQDRDLKLKLQLEMQGILRWSVEGAARLINQRGHFTGIPESVDLIAEYRREQNPLIEFLEECTAEEPFVLTPVSELRKTFALWWRGGSRVTPVQFGRWLGAAGVQVEVRKIDGRAVRCAVGRKVLP